MRHLERPPVWSLPLLILLLLPLLLLACAATAPAAIAAPGSLLDGHTLTVCIDWLTGWTSHADGIALATGGAAAASTKAPKQDRQVVVQLTDEQLRSFGLLGDSDDDEPSEEEIRSAMEHVAPQPDEPAQPAKRSAELVPQDREAVPGRAGYGYGHADHWSRRAVRYLNALSRGKDDPTESVQRIARLQRTVNNLPEAQLRAEDSEANDVVMAAHRDGAITRKQAQRIQAALEVGPFTRLHTTSTTDDPKAGFLLPKPFLAEVFVLVEQFGVVRQWFRAIPMVSKDLDLKNVANKVAAFWVGEGENIPASFMEFGEQKLEAKKLAGVTAWTHELEEDQAIALLPIVAEMFAESFVEKEDRAGLVGGGTSADGGFTGLLHLAGTVITLGAGNTAGDDLSEADVRAAKQALTLARRQGAEWAMHPSFQDHIAQMENGAGFRIFQEQIRDAAGDRLLGFPIRYSEVMPSVDEVGPNERFMLLGRGNRALMGQRRGMTADISREAIIQRADGSVLYNAYQADGALLRMTERVGFQVPTAVRPAFVAIRTAAAG